ncbi:MAG: hypothetical protein ABS949_14765 [Solibacillus sp.]
MAIPRSVTRISRDGNVTYTQSVDRVNYTIRELTRAALRDVGKYVCKQFQIAFYRRFKKHTGRVGKFTQYWVKYKQENIELQVGMKPNGFYGGFQELGTSKTTKQGLLTHAVQDNIATIIEIESKYLSALEDEARALSLISEEDYEGDGDEN